MVQGVQGVQEVQREQGYRGCRNVQSFLQDSFYLFAKAHALFASLESSLSGPFHGLNKSIHCFSDLVSLCVNLAEFILGDVGEVESDVELRLNFGEGTFCDKEKLKEFSVTPSAKSLGNVRHRGDGGALDLVLQPIIFREAVLLRKTVDSFC